MPKKHPIKRIKQKIEIWKEILPTIGKSEFYRLLGRLKHHARILSYRPENGKIALIVSYPSFRERINGRVVLSSWIGRGNYQSIKLTKSSLTREVKRKF
jgi:hypothetical protein